MRHSLKLGFKRFLASTSVVLFVTGVPFFVAQAAAPACEIVHKKASKVTHWTQIESLADKVDHLIKTYTSGAQEFYAARSFANEIKKLSEASQKEWIFAIGQAYRKIPKKDPNPFAARHIGGRRVMDHALALLENYQGKFDTEINQKGVPPLEAYRHFMTRQHQMFGTNYTAREVEIVISTIKAELQRIEKMNQQAPLKILISGSFPNGKADMKSSDIDLSISNAGMMKETYDWQSLINQAFKNAGADSNLELAFSSEGIQFYGKINPVIIEVSAHETRLLVFPPGVERQGYADDVLAGQPQVYILQSN